MKTKSFMTFSIVAILMATVGVISFSTQQNLLAQNTTTTTGLNMTDNNTKMMTDNPKMTMGKDYQKYDMGKKHEKINGTINVMDTMYQALASKFNVTLPQAINTAEQTIGNGSYAMSATGEEKDGFLTYSIILGTPDMKFYKVIVDPGNGQVLASDELSMIDWMMTMEMGKHQEKGMMGMHSGYDKKGNNGYPNQW